MKEDFREDRNYELFLILPQSTFQFLTHYFIHLVLESHLCKRRGDPKWSLRPLLGSESNTPPHHQQLSCMSRTIKERPLCPEMRWLSTAPWRNESDKLRTENDFLEAAWGWEHTGHWVIISNTLSRIKKLSSPTPPSPASFLTETVPWPLWCLWSSKSPELEAVPRNSFLRASGGRLAAPSSPSTYCGPLELSEGLGCTWIIYLSIMLTPGPGRAKAQTDNWTAWVSRALWKMPGILYPSSNREIIPHLEAPQRLFNKTSVYFLPLPLTI